MTNCLKEMHLDAGEWNTHGIKLSEEGKLEKAVLSFSTALELDPGNSDIIYNLGLVYTKMEEWDTAGEFYNKALKISPGNTDYLLELGITWYHRNNRDKALEIYKKVLESDPVNSRCWNCIGVIHFTSGEYSKALEAFSASVKIDPENIDGWFNLRDTKYELNDMKGAKEADRIYNKLERESR